MIRTAANKANHDGKDYWQRYWSCSPVSVSQPRRRLLRRPLVRSLGGLPRDTATVRQFFDPGLQAARSSLKDEPYDFFVQSPTWKLGAVSISILRRQFDKTYVAVAFDNHGRAVTLNFIVVNGPTAG
jgi:hypothetical protein